MTPTIFDWGSETTPSRANKILRLMPEMTSVQEEEEEEEEEEDGLGSPSSLMGIHSRVLLESEFPKTPTRSGRKVDRPDGWRMNRFISTHWSLDVRLDEESHLSLYYYRSHFTQISSPITSDGGFEDEEVKSPAPTQCAKFIKAV